MRGFGRNGWFRSLVYLLAVLLAVQVWPVSIVQAEGEQPGFAVPPETAPLSNPEGSEPAPAPAPDPAEDEPSPETPQPTPSSPDPDGDEKGALPSPSDPEEPDGGSLNDEGLVILQAGEVEPPDLYGPKSPTKESQFVLYGCNYNDSAALINVYMSIDGGEPQSANPAPIETNAFDCWEFNYTAPGDGTYVFTATATVDGQESEPSSPLTVVVDTTPPPPPQVQGWAVSDEIVALAWDPPAGDVVHYQVYRDGQLLSEEFDPIWVAAWDSEPSFVDAPLQAETDYTYTVVAFDHLGNESEASEPLVVTTAPAPPRFSFRLANTDEAGEILQSRSQASEPVISGDGSVVAFSARETGLLDEPFDWHDQVFVKNLRSGALRHISVNAGGEPADGRGVPSDMTPDGRFVVFASVADNLDEYEDDPFGGTVSKIYLWDSETGELERVDLFSSGEPMGRAGSASISDDGRRVLFLANPAFSGVNAYVRDREAGTTRLISNLPSGKQPEFFRDAMISGDGRFTVFSAADGSLVAFVAEGLEMEDGTTESGVFLYDRTTKNVEYITFRDRGIDLFRRAWSSDPDEVEQRDSVSGQKGCESASDGPQCPKNGCSATGLFTIEREPGDLLISEHRPGSCAHR